MSSDQDTLPFFPLSVFLLPGEDIPLRIFEPRYKQLIEDAKSEGITFAIPYVKESEILDLGCEVRLKEIVAEHPAGRMVVNVECVSVVAIESYSVQLGNKLYAGGSIRRLPSPALLESTRLKSFIANYTEHFDPDFLKCCQDSVITHYDVLKALNLSSEEKFNFIQLDSIPLKENFLITQLRFLMMIRNQEQLLGNDFGLN